MAFCQQCGQEIPDGQTLCAACAGETPAPAENAAAAAPYFQPDFSAVPAPVFTPAPQNAFRIPMGRQGIPAEYKPLGAWTYFLYAVLFSIPLVGLVLLIVFSCGGTTNYNLRNYARSYFCAMLVALVLAAVAVAVVMGLGWNVALWARTWLS